MKYIKKIVVCTAFFIDFSKPELFPAGVQSNALSPSGYSYGTLQPMPDGDLDGLPVWDQKWLVFNENGIPRIMENADFLRQYEAF